MNTVIKRYSVLSATALALLLGGCENLGETTAPALEPSPVVVTSTSGQRFVVAYELNPSAGAVSANIGAAGGALVLGSHVLWVSRGAVAETAKFTMTRDPEFPLRVKLTASRSGDNDVGSQGFAAPVMLGISYRDVANAPRDPGQIEMVYFRPDGLVETVSSQVWLWDRLVVAKLPHFSLFGLAWP